MDSPQNSLFPPNSCNWESIRLSPNNQNLLLLTFAQVDPFGVPGVWLDSLPTWLALEVDRILCYDNGPTIVIGGGPFVALVTPTKVGVSPNYPQESAFETIFIRRSHTIPHTYAKTTPWQHSRIDIFQADDHKSSWTKSGGINSWARPWWVRGIGLTSNWSGIDKQLRALTVRAQKDVPI